VWTIFLFIVAFIFTFFVLLISDAGCDRPEEELPLHHSTVANPTEFTSAAILARRLAEARSYMLVIHVQAASFVKHVAHYLEKTGINMWTGIIGLVSGYDNGSGDRGLSATEGDENNALLYTAF
jgi:hypothetical protein